MQTTFDTMLTGRPEEGASTLTTSLIDKLSLAYIRVAFFSLSLHGVPKDLWRPIALRALGEMGFVGDLSTQSIGFLYVGRDAEQAGGLAKLERTIIERISAVIRDSVCLREPWQLDVAATQCRSCDLQDMRSWMQAATVRHYEMGSEEELHVEAA